MPTRVHPPVKHAYDFNLMSLFVHSIENDVTRHRVRPDTFVNAVTLVAEVGKALDVVDGFIEVRHVPPGMDLAPLLSASNGNSGDVFPSMRREIELESSIPHLAPRVPQRQTDA